MVLNPKQVKLFLILLFDISLQTCFNINEKIKFKFRNSKQNYLKIQKIKWSKIWRRQFFNWFYSKWLNIMAIRKKNQKILLQKWKKLKD